MEVSLVKACIQNMIYYGIVTLIPIFQYCNIYVTTPRLVELYSDTALSEECLRACAKQDSTTMPAFKHVFQMFSAMKPGVTVKEICIRQNPSQLGIDEKKLIRFGLMKGILRQLQKYPVMLNADPSSIAAQRSIVYRYFDGNHNYDEICVQTAKNFSELEERVEKHPSAVTIWK